VRPRAHHEYPCSSLVRCASAPLLLRGEPGVEAVAIDAVGTGIIGDHSCALLIVMASGDGGGGNHAWASSE
jgi:hypothetical protein